MKLFKQRNADRNAVHWIKEVWWAGSILFSALVLVWVAFQIVMGTLGARIEAKYVPPILELDMLGSYCVDGGFENDAYPDRQDAVVIMFLHKREYWFDGIAEFRGFQVYDTDNPPSRLAWKRPDSLDRSPQNRPAGEQVFRVIVKNGCNTPMVMETIHRSPITGNLLHMWWPQNGGTFDPSDYSKEGIPSPDYEEPSE